MNPTLDHCAMTFEDGLAILSFTTTDLRETQMTVLHEDFGDVVATAGLVSLAVDLSAIKQWSSSFLGALVTLKTRFDALNSGGKICVFGATEGLKASLRITRLGTLLNAQEDEDAARKFLSV